MIVQYDKCTRMWIPKCYREGTPCLSYYLFMHTGNFN